MTFCPETPLDTELIPVHGVVPAGRLDKFAVQSEALEEREKSFGKVIVTECSEPVPADDGSAHKVPDRGAEAF